MKKLEIDIDNIYSFANRYGKQNLTSDEMDEVNVSLSSATTSIRTLLSLLRATRKNSKNRYLYLETKKRIISKEKYLTAEQLISFIEKITKLERDPWLNLLDEKIGTVNFNNYEEINKKCSTLSEANNIITNKITVFLQETFKRNLTFREMKFLLEKSKSNSRTNKVFKKLILQRGLKPSEKKELIKERLSISQTPFLMSFVEKEIKEIEDRKKEINLAIDTGNKEEIRRLTDLLLNIDF